VSLTDPGGSATAALHALQTLAQTAARTIQGLLEGLLHRPQTTRASRTIRPRPAPQPVPAAPRHADAVTPGADGASTREQPPAYGQSRVVLVARDPWALFAHWDIQPVRRVEVLRGLGAEGEYAEEVLRLYDTATAHASFRDLVLAPGAARAHLDVADAGRTYRVEVGLRTSTGRFVPLATSNLATTPAAQPSQDTSVRWVAPRADGPPAEVTVPWNGRRVAPVATATALDRPARVGSSEGLPPGPRASDALPFR
jgi:hypothetical protein